MSSSVQHKLLSIEATPPPGVWEKISTELDEADLEYHYPAALYELAATPPAGTWQKIAAQLDVLTATAETASEKLHTLEVAPPIAAWSKIEATLDSEHEAAIPEHRRLSPMLRYAAAAVVIGLLAWGGFSLINNKPSEKIAAAKETTASPGTTLTPTTSAESASVAPEHAPENTAITSADKADEARNDAALEASKKTFAKLEINGNSKIKQAANFYFATAATRSIDITAEDPGNTGASGGANRYIMLMTPDGNIIRMSKKLSNLLCCVSGEEQDKECKDQMNKWREKIACSPSSHSPGNFMDILNLASLLQEENEL